MPTLLAVAVSLALAASVDGGVPAAAPSPGAPAPPRKLAAIELSTTGVSPETRAFLSEHVAQRLALAGLSVISSAEIGAVVGLERQRALLGCEDSKSCVAELANALGVDAVVMGSVGKFEDAYQINLKVVSAADASALAFASKEATGERGMIAALNQAADELARALGATPPPGASRPGALAAPAESAGTTGGAAPIRRFVMRPSPIRAAGLWTLLGSGAVILGGGAVAIGGAVAETNWVMNTGGVLMGLGLLGAGVGGLMTVVGREESVPVTATLVPTASGGLVVVAGPLPGGL